MSQKSSSTVNFVIHDAKGQPQMIKVVQQGSSPKSPVAVPPETAIAQEPVYKTVNITTMNGTSKLVQVPVQTLAHLQKTVLETEKRKKKDILIEVPSMVDESFEVTPSKTIKIEPEDSPEDEMPSSARNGFTGNYRKRSIDQEMDSAEYSTKRRRAADKVGKGLRHFSKKVCEKVRNKGFTSYNEVADELVAEFTASLHGNVTQQFDQKNIRRRVYDALNVLMAMNIISKEKKEIRWLGLPTNSAQECSLLEKDKQCKLQRIQHKTQQLHDLIMQQISFKSLVERNRAAEARGLRPSPSSAIHLPFIVVNTSEKALIDCSISNDKTEYMFKFNKRFQIHDDIDILKRMGLLFGLDKGECTEEDLYRAKCMVPKSLGYYLEHMAQGRSSKLSEILEASGDEESDHSSTDTDLSAEEDEDDA